MASKPEKRKISSPSDVGPDSDVAINLDKDISGLSIKRSRLPSSMSSSSDENMESCNHEDDSFPSNNGAKEGSKKTAKLAKTKETFPDGYDSDMMGDEEDRETLKNMTEKDRELVIYNRRVERDRLIDRVRIEEKLRLKAKAQQANKALESESESNQKSELTGSEENENFDNDGERQDKGHDDEQDGSSSGSTSNSIVGRRNRSKLRKKSVQDKSIKRAEAIQAIQNIREDRKQRLERKEIKLREREEREQEQEMQYEYQYQSSRSPLSSNSDLTAINVRTLGGDDGDIQLDLDLDLELPPPSTPTCIVAETTKSRMNNLVVPGLYPEPEVDDDIAAYSQHGGFPIHKDRNSNMHLGNNIYNVNSKSPGESSRRTGGNNNVNESSEVPAEDRYRIDQPKFVNNVHDLIRIQISRMKILKWIHLPFFNRLAKGSFVRVTIGANPNPNPGGYEGKQIYRIAEILEVVEIPQVYQLGGTRTNKAVRLRHGSDTTVLRLEYVSNSTFTWEEFERWMIDTCRNRVSLPTMQEIEAKEQEIIDANNYELNEEDVNHMVKEKKKFETVPVNYALKKMSLIKDRQNAISMGDEARAVELAKEIEDVDERSKHLDRQRTSKISVITYINERNRRKNLEQAEQAIKDELEQKKGKFSEDPFTRRMTKPKPTRCSLNNNNNNHVPGTGVKLESPTLDLPPSQVESTDNLHGKFEPSAFNPCAGVEGGIPMEDDAVMADPHLPINAIDSAEFPDPDPSANSLVFKDGKIPMFLNRGIDLFDLHDIEDDEKIFRSDFHAGDVSSSPSPESHKIKSLTFDPPRLLSPKNSLTTLSEYIRLKRSAF